MTAHRLSPLMRSTAVATVAAFCGVLILTAAPASAQTVPPAVGATVETSPSASLEIQGGFIAVDSNGETRLIAATSLGGLVVYDDAGRRLDTVAAGEAAGLGVAYGFPLNGQPTTLVGITDVTDNSLRFFALRDGTLSDVGATPEPVGFAAENICFHHHALDGLTYAFVMGDGGEIDQRLVYESAPGRVSTRAVRRIQVPSPVEQCAADSASGLLYVAEETVGLWRLSADAEADVDATLIDSARLGALSGEVKGLTLYDGGPGARWLIASDSEAGRLNVYDRENDDAYIGSFAVAAADETVGEPGRLSALGLGAGSLTVVDEDGLNLKVVSVADIAAAIGRPAGAPQDPRLFHDSALPTVTATVQSVSVDSFGDAADDPAIWVHPTDPAQSLILATDKKAGLYVYDMQGQVVQFLPVGKVNNVDVRDGFSLNGESATIVTASNRTTRGISIFRLDPETRLLTDVADGLQPTELNDPYGQCMYRNPQSGRTYVFINGDETRKRQWELIDAGNGRVRAEFVRELTFGSQTEGCVADDETGVLYVGEEDVALWRISAEPDGGTELTAVDTIASNPAMADDLEGVALYDLGGGRGYIIGSSQGNDTYAVWRREGSQEYLGSFAIVADPALGIDGASETDGLEVTSRDLGPGFEHGALIVQDGRRVMPQSNQNYKYVPWSAIAEALNLEVRQAQ